MLEKWAGTTRYVYNKILNKIKQDPKLESTAGYKLLNKECITELDNNIIKENEINKFDKFMYDWELETPKDIRNGALRDIKKAYKTAWSNLKAGNIRSFGLNQRLKKNGNEQSMEVPRSAIKFVKKKNKIVGLTIYKTYFDGSNQKKLNKKYKNNKTNKINPCIKIDKRSLKDINLKDLEHDTRLKKENNQWYLCISYDVKGVESKLKEKTCALDPGIRKFQTIYSEDNIITISPDKEKVKKIYETLDKFDKIRSKKLISNRTYNKKRCKVQAKLTNLVDDMHYKTIAFLTKNYTSILLPSFETQDMVCSKKLSKETKRNMMNFSFYKFKQRLEHKCKLLRHCNVTIVNEAYTSQTCGYCGNLKKTSDEIITCSSCNKIFDRDVNGSRNIYLKYVR